MSSYLYAVIPYESPFIFPSTDGENFCFGFVPKELESLHSKLCDPDGITTYGDFLLFNTCVRMSSLCCDTHGFCAIRSEIYKIAKALKADEVWYVEELCTDQMDEPSFSLEKLKERMKTDLAYCTMEVSLDSLKQNKWASYNHDVFADIVVERHK